ACQPTPIDHDHTAVHPHPGPDEGHAARRCRPPKGPAQTEGQPLTRTEPEVEDLADRPDVGRCPHAVLPMPVFRALGGQETLGARAWARTSGEAARARAGALRWLRELTDLEGPGPGG